MRGLHLTRGAHLTLADRQLVITQEATALRVALEDIAWIVLDTPQVTLTTALISACMEAGCAIVTTDVRHMPSGLGLEYAAIGPSWRRSWSEVVPFYAFPADVRRMLYTTNAIEALNAKLRSAVRTRDHFPTDKAALKLLYLVLNRTEKAWTMPPREWATAKAQFAVLFGQRFTRAMA